MKVSLIDLRPRSHYAGFARSQHQIKPYQSALQPQNYDAMMDFRKPAKCKSLRNKDTVKRL